MTADAYTFELAWRWTQPTHNVLPADVMAQIKPLERSPTPIGLTARGELEPLAFEDIRSAPMDRSPDAVRSWLQQLLIKPSQQVVVRWAESTAVETSWDIFVRYWDDFCYPSSDDIEVFPTSAAWILLYRHGESFEWAQRGN